jgi:outer membrane protein OmpA-like peptidoglycan-associated protein
MLFEDRKLLFVRPFKSMVAAAMVGTMLALPAAAADLSDLVRTANALETRNYNTVHFDFNEDGLDRRARLKLQQQADFILRRPDTRFAVTGHTDKVGNQAYNRNLGLRRAKRVVAHLVKLGVDPGQLEAMVSLGEDRPVIDTEDRERKNRRVVTTVIVPKTFAERRSTGGSSSPVYAASTLDRQVPPGEEPLPSASTTSAPAPTGSGTTSKPRPGNSSFGTGKPDAGSGNGDEASGDPAGSVGHNRGGDEKP